MGLFLDYGNGSAGSASGVSGVINTYATCTATGGTNIVTTSLSVVVGDLVFLWQTQGTGATNCEMVRVQATGGGNFTTTKNLINSYLSSAQAIKVPQYTSGTFGALSATAWNGSIGGLCIATGAGPLTIPTTNFNGLGFRGGAGQAAGGQPGGFGSQGESTIGLGSQNINANGIGGGGGQSYLPGDGSDAAGGGGGYASSGSDGTGVNGNNHFGRGGGVIGNANLSAFSLGGGGGGGGAGAGENAGDGGNGSGGCIIFAPSITIGGSITVNGQNGQNVGFSGGGAGAGGPMLLGGQTINLGSGLITALGGSGGSGNAQGGAGGIGRIAVYAPTSALISGTTNPSYTFVADSSFNPQGGLLLF